MSVDILYIGGAGRSGTTILGAMLGYLPTFRFVGELRYFWVYAAYHEEICACQQPITECEWWSDIYQALKADIDIERVADISKSLNRTIRFPWVQTRISPQARESWSALRDATAQLYRETAARSEAPILLDSSKSPAQLWLLKSIPDFRIRLLHVIRDSRAVVYSWERAKSDLPYRPPIRSMLGWSAENRLTLNEAEDLEYTQLRYEDFAHNPVDEIERVLSDLNCEPVGIERLREEPLILPQMHDVSGNSDRFKRREIVIRPDYRWREEMSGLRKGVLGFFTASLLSRFGYK